MWGVWLVLDSPFVWTDVRELWVMFVYGVVR